MISLGWRKQQQLSVMYVALLFEFETFNEKESIKAACQTLSFSTVLPYLSDIYEQHNISEGKKFRRIHWDNWMNIYFKRDDSVKNLNLLL